jgi:hypothetical protein
MYDLEAILKYQMDELQAKAFKIALMWETFAEREFPGYQHVRLRKNGDPRQSILWKYCYKLARETQGIIPDEEYKLYVLAQLHIMKHANPSGIYARIDPAILCGDKAWKRWKVWKRIYDQKKQQYLGENTEKITARKAKIEQELNNTKKFFFEKYGGAPSYEQVRQAMYDHSMIRWVTIDMVSPYYILMSPFVSRSLEGRGLDDFFLFDLNVYRGSITPEIRDLFCQIFSYEF